MILSISTAAGDASHQIPFYSDDVYLWLCLKDFPEPEDARTPQPLISSGGASTETKPKKKPSKYKRPNGELNVKYNASEYRQLWNASWELRERLNRSMDTSDQDEEGESEDENAQPISHNDIEKVAFVLRNVAFSGFYQYQDPEAFLKARAEIEKANQPPPDDTPKRHKKKRKHQDEKDGGSKGKGSRNSKRSKQIRQQNCANARAYSGKSTETTETGSTGASSTAVESMSRMASSTAAHSTSTGLISSSDESTTNTEQSDSSSDEKPSKSLTGLSATSSPSQGVAVSNRVAETGMWLAFLGMGLGVAL